jgi:hypothetical protein
MTQDEIVKMAREAGLVRTGDKWVEPARWGVTELVHFAALVAAAEREACAELAVKGTDEPVQTKTLEILRKERERIAAAIRARGEQ